MVAVPRYSWPGPAAGFGALGGPLPIRAEGPEGAVPRRSWLGLLLAVVWWLLPRHFWRRALWVQFPAIPDWGVLLGLVRWVVPRQSWRRSL